jgi:hypothetical protein
MKHRFIAQHLKPKKSIHDVETPITSHSKGIQRNAISKEHSNNLLGAQRHTSCVFLWPWQHTNCWVLLWYTEDVRAGHLL